MFTFTITVDEAQLHRVIAALESLSSPAAAAFVADAVGREGVMPEARNAPPQSGKPMAFTSNAQRRAFFANLRSGAISVPYQRTGRLIAGWHQAGPFSVTNAVGYADLVVTKGKQAAYHAGNWQTDADIAAKVERTTAEPIATGAIIEFAAKKGLN